MNILLYSKKWRWSIGISKLVYLFFLSLFVSGLQKVYGQQEITNAVPFARIGCPSSTLVGSATTFTFCYDNRVSIRFSIKYKNTVSDMVYIFKQRYIYIYTHLYIRDTCQGVNILHDMKAKFNGLEIDDDHVFFSF